MIFNLNRPSDVMMVQTAYAGKRLGLTSGSFDLLHVMHLAYLERCRRKCDLLIVGIDSDDLVRARKGADRPMIGEKDRVALVAALDCVEAVFVLDSLEDFGRAVQDLGIKVIFKNGEYKPEEVIGREHAEVVIVPDSIPLASTTAIMQEIARRRAANPPESEETPPTP